MADIKNPIYSVVRGKAAKGYEDAAAEERKLGDRNAEAVLRENARERANIRKADKPLTLGSMKNVDEGSGRGTTTFGEGKTFKQAFAEAREAGKGSFTWNGKKYTTEMAGEKKSPTASNLERETTSYDYGTTNPSEFKRGGKVKKYAKGGVVTSSASKRADGCAQRGKTRGKMV